MVFHGVLADEQLPGDLPIRFALRDEFENLQLTGGEVRGGHPARPVVRSARQSGELDHEFRCHRGADQAQAVVYRTDRARHLMRWYRLQQVPDRARLDGLEKVGLVITDRQHHNLCGGHFPLDRARRVDAVPVRHPDVHQDDVRGRSGCDRDSLAAVAGAADDGDVLFKVENGLKTLQEQLMIIDDEHPDGFGRRLHGWQNTDHHQRSELPGTDGPTTDCHGTDEVRSTHVPTLCDGGLT